VNLSRRPASLQRCGGHRCPEGTCDHRQEPGLLQRNAMGLADRPAPQIVREVLASPGRPLDAHTRVFMESHLGHHFGAVRVHTGDRAERSARSVNALAYAVGSHLVFAAGAYRPEAEEGRRLLAHELTHVVQQAGSAPPQSEISVAPSDDPAEREAEGVAASFSSDRAGDRQQHRPEGVLGNRVAARPQLQRQGTVPDSGSGASEASSGKCYTCDISGGVGVCCYTPNPPMVPECFDLGKRIVDGCQSDREECNRQAQCAQCQCIGQKRGQQYCQCTGIV